MTISIDAIKKCRISFIHFVAAIRPDFIFSDFSRSICNELQKFYVSSIKGEMPSLLLQAPPQHGKSLLCAELFPSWVLGINPNKRTAVATYAFPLARRRNIEIQRIIESDIYKQIFPETKLRQGNKIIEGAKNAEEFEIIGKHGGLRCVGVGGSLTGFSVDIGIIDDPYKDMAEARSNTQNNTVIEWYNSVFKTRLSKQSGVVMMLTRWATNDLAAWCISNENWNEHKYQAIEKGKALVSALHPIEQLQKIKTSMPDSIWEAMYQQNPYIQGGNIIKEEWIKYYSVFPEKFERIFITGDTAQKLKEHNDFSVFTCFGSDGNFLYILDMWRGKVTAPGLKVAALEFWDKWGMGVNSIPCSGFYIEDKASGTGLIQDLQASAPIPIIPVPRSIDKYTRLMDVLNYIQAGKLWLPANAVYTNLMVGEMSAFSGDMKHEHDDIVDTIIDGLFINFGPGMVSMLDVL